MIVLDTHVVIWDALTPNRLSAEAGQVIAQANQRDGVIISDISLWEIAMLIEKGQVQVDVGCQAFINLLLQANKTIVRALSAQIATLAVQFPDEITKDPADRLIAATTIVENASLITADRNLRSSSLIPTLW